MPKERAPKPKQPEEIKPENKVSSRFQVTTQEDLAGAEKQTQNPATPKKEEVKKESPKPVASPKLEVKKEPVKQSRFQVVTQEKLEAKKPLVEKAEPKIIKGEEKPKKSEAKKEIPKKPEPLLQKKNLPAEKEKTAQKPGSKKETGAEKQSQPLEKARESYVRAKLELEKNPGNSATKKNFENSQKAYLKERQMDLQGKLELFKKDAKFSSAELLKHSANAYLINEFRKNYDLKTKILVEQKEKETPWLLKKIYQASDEYRKMPLKKKLLISGALLGGGVIAGAVGGGTGLALATFIGGGRITQRLLSSGASFIGLEGLMKKSQEQSLADKDIEESQKLNKFFAESFDAAKVQTAKGLVKFLQSRDFALTMEKKTRAAEEKVLDLQKKLENRRYLLAGTLGVLTASGLTAEGIGNIAHSLGLDFSHFFHAAEAKTALVPLNANPESVVHAVEQHANATATIEKGGSISKSAWQLVYEGKISKEEMLRAWKNSSVEIHGVKVPIKDVGLSHAGDQVTYVPGAGNAPGHFEVADYAKDKLSLGTNEDLLKIYQKVGKEAPHWLKEAASHGHRTIETQITETTKHLGAGHLTISERVKDLEIRFNHGDLSEKEIVLDHLDYQIGHGHLDRATGKIFANLRDHLKYSAEYNKALESYEKFFKPIGLSNKEYDVIKNMKVGEFLSKRGRSWLSDYFFHPDSTPFASAAKGATPVSEILHQRKLAQLIRKIMISAWEKNLTVDEFVKMSIK